MLGRLLQALLLEAAPQPQAEALDTLHIPDHQPDLLFFLLVEYPRIRDAALQEQFLLLRVALLLRHALRARPLGAQVGLSRLDPDQSATLQRPSLVLDFLHSRPALDILFDLLFQFQLVLGFFLFLLRRAHHVPSRARHLQVLARQRVLALAGLVVPVRALRVRVLGALRHTGLQLLFRVQRLSVAEDLVQTDQLAHVADGPHHVGALAAPGLDVGRETGHAGLEFPVNELRAAQLGLELLVFFFDRADADLVGLEHLLDHFLFLGEAGVVGAEPVDLALHVEHVHLQLLDFLQIHLRVDGWWLRSQIPRESPAVCDALNSDSSTISSSFVFFKLVCKIS